MFPKSDQMELLSIIPSDQLSPSDYTGLHYFVYVQGQKKQADISEGDCIVYSIIHKRLKNSHRVMVVQYTSLHSQKYAVIYPKDDHLMLSIIHYSDQHRKPNINVLREIDEEDLELLDDLFESKQEDSIGIYNDPIQPAMKQMIEEAVTASASGNPIKKTKKKIVPATGALAKLRAAKGRSTPTTEKPKVETKKVETKKVETKKVETKKVETKKEKSGAKKSDAETESDNSDSDNETKKKSDDRLFLKPNPDDSSTFIVSGKTFPVKEQLKKHGATFNRKHKAWIVSSERYEDILEEFPDIVEEDSNVDHSDCDGDCVLNHPHRIRQAPKPKAVTA
jgi:hypothetical protein